jgi:ABC-type spermidine/putrescine transport system permease subunit II
MFISRRLRGMLLGATGCLLLIIYIPLILVVVYAFNPSRSQKWPIEGYHAVGQCRAHQSRRP